MTKEVTLVAAGKPAQHLVLSITASQGVLDEDMLGHARPEGLDLAQVGYFFNEALRKKSSFIYLTSFGTHSSLWGQVATSQKAHKKHPWTPKSAGPGPSLSGLHG